MNSLEQVINLKVEVKTLIDETIVGTIYAFSPKQHVIALKCGSSSDGKGLFRIINSSFIKTITIAHPVPKKFSKHSEQFKGRPVDLKKLEARLKSAVERAAPPNASTSTQKNEPASGKSNQNNTQVPKRSEPTALALKVHNKLVAKFGKENVSLQNNDAILLFKEVLINKPYALNKISNSKKSQSSKHLDKVKTALREIWLLGNNSEQGG